MRKADERNLTRSSRLLGVDADAVSGRVENDRPYVPEWTGDGCHDACPNARAAAAVIPAHTRNPLE
jgi:hypothetical protein